MKNCLELGENFEIPKETLESYWDTNMTPEEICLEMVDLWLDQGRASCSESNCDDPLSMRGLLWMQRKQAAKELEVSIKKKFAELREKDDVY